MTPGPTHPNMEARRCRTLNLQATGTQVLDTVLGGTVGEQHHGRERYALGELSVTPFWEGTCCAGRS